MMPTLPLLPDWLDVPRGTIDRWQAYLDLLVDENQRQNLVSGATLADAWQRHILDSAQLLPLAPVGAARWLDLGSGAGLPGLVVAAAIPAPMLLVESRRLRTDFLQRAAAVLELPHVSIHAGRVETLDSMPHDVITARAFAPLERLLPLAARFSHPGTRWLLPRGRSGAEELAEVTRLWQGRFRIVPSRTDARSVIVVLDGVPTRKGKRT